MTEIERECRFEWIEAEITWHYQAIGRHNAALADLDRLWSELCKYRPLLVVRSGKVVTLRGEAA